MQDQDSLIWDVLRKGKTAHTLYLIIIKIISKSKLKIKQNCFKMFWEKVKLQKPHKLCLIIIKILDIHYNILRRYICLCHSWRFFDYMCSQGRLKLKPHILKTYYRPLRSQSRPLLYPVFSPEIQSLFLLASRVRVGEWSFWGRQSEVWGRLKYIWTDGGVQTSNGHIQAT